MAYTPTNTRNTGDLINASIYNTELIGNIDHIMSMLANGTALSALSAGSVIGFQFAIVGKTANQSIPSGSATAVTFDTEVSDVHGWHDNATNNERITPDEAGLYLVVLSIQWASNPSQQFSPDGLFNGVRFSRLDAGINSATTQGGAFAVYMNGSTDYVSITATQNSGGALNLETSRTYLGVFKIG